MKKISATEFARTLSDVLDSVEHRRESFEVVRKGRPVARVTPASTPNGAASKEALKRLRADDEFAEEIRQTRGLLVDEDPWRD